MSDEPDDIHVQIVMDHDVPMDDASAEVLATQCIGEALVKLHEGAVKPCFRGRIFAGKDDPCVYWVFAYGEPCRLFLMLHQKQSDVAWEGIRRMSDAPHAYDN